MYALHDNGLKIEIFTYSLFIDSITQPDTSLIQLSTLCKISWKDLSSIYLSELIIALVVELKQTGVSSMSPFSLRLLGKNVQRYWI